MSSTPATIERETEPFVGAVRMEWFQMLDAVTFTFYVKNRLSSDVQVSVGSTSLDVTIKLDAHGRDYHYDVEHLYADVDTDKGAEVIVKSMKVEVKVHKMQPIQWTSLQRDAHSTHVLGTSVAPPLLPSAEAPAATSTGAASALSAEPTRTKAKKKDWSALKLDDEDEKSDGEDALNKLFKQIYGNGTDEQRRAMIKSFTESGGTVLSTNWEDVGSRKVVAEPPKGMEAKRLSE